NYGYRATSGDKAEQRAAEQSFASSTLWAFSILGESNGSVLVDATNFILRDAMHAANRINTLRQGQFVFDSSRSAIYLPGSKNFPLNTELEGSISFVNKDGIVGNFVQSVAPSPEAFTLRIHHSFVQLPDDQYQVRSFDPRSSFIPISYYDFSTPVSEPIIKYNIIRHRLEKKDPSAIKSEAVKPIIYYLDNGTPEPIRSALLEGARWWNQAFEAAGYINAFQVMILPEDADPMDIRYNMINWVHRSTRGWSYGASVVDPRTGEIIKGNVTLGSLRVRQDYLIAQGLLAPFENGMPADDQMLRMALNRLKQLSAHEVGHTIGLMHNYAASVSKLGSVMDYPHPVVKFTSSGEPDLSQAYDAAIGEWDKVAVSWGYADFPKGTNEKSALDKILKDAASRGLQFISDQDARARSGLHPSAHLWDNGVNAVDELKHVMVVRQKALSKFGLNNIRDGMPMAMLEDVLVPVYLFHRYQVEAAVKLVGGMHYTYAIKGDGQQATAPLSESEQMKALDVLLETIDPSVLVLPENIVKLIPPRPAGFAGSRELFRKRTGLSFDALSPAEMAADLSLSLLLNTERLNRLAEFGVMNMGPGLDKVINTVVEKTWKAERRKGMEGLIQIQTEQLVLTYLMAASQDENSSFVTKSFLSKSITDLRLWVEEKRKGNFDHAYSGHLLLALDRIRFPDKAKPTLHAVMPPGAPIGCEN
ncbi:MAG: zinc-dependent metalloprotease, partial [Flavisolibacter sp.]